MATVIVRHAVADYSKWKPVFDEHEGARREYGFRSHILHRDVDNPSMIGIVFQVDDVDRAREFLRSDTLRDAMKRAGVQGQPDVWIGEDLEAVDYEQEERRPSAREGVSAPVQH